MAAKRHERTSARRAALQVLYTSEITDESPAAIAEGNRRLEEDGPLPEYALKLVLGVESHRCAIDDHLAATSENWSLARMPIVDRSILRLATFEMMYVDDVPTSVTINEAVELAKDWRTDRMLRKLEALLAVADENASLIITGNGDVIQPENDLIAIGSGGPYAQAASRALLENTELSAREIVDKALGIAGDICIYTNQFHTIEELDSKA